MSNQASRQKSNQQKKTASQDSAQTAFLVSGNPWQAKFTKRLPHRIGQPLSSSGGGNGCSSMPM